MMTITTIIDMIMIDTTMIEMIADLGGRRNVDHFMIEGPQFHASWQLTFEFTWIYTRSTSIAPKKTALKALLNRIKNWGSY
jgi:hypothetical protein